MGEKSMRVVAGARETTVSVRGEKSKKSQPDKGWD